MGVSMFEWIASPEAWLALVTLTALEIVLGIDNIIFISICVGRLPPERRNELRQRFRDMTPDQRRQLRDRLRQRDVRPRPSDRPN